MTPTSKGWRSAKVRRARADVQPFVDVLNHEMPADLEYHLLGSWRRGAPDIGDIDVLIVTESGEMGDTLFGSGVELPTSFHAQRRGPKVAQGDLVLPDDSAIHLDFWSCKPIERGAYLCFATGPMQLNLAQRRRAIKLGYALSQIGLLQNGVQIDDGTEEDIYRLIEWPWLTPEQRQKWASVNTASRRPQS